MLSSSTDVVALARQEAFKDFSFFDEETVPVVSQSIVSTVSISLFLSLSLSLSLSSLFLLLFAYFSHAIKTKSEHTYIDTILFADAHSSL